ncbi:MAG TPA: V-type ATPase 116kDa subunit family protein [Nitrososphaerales archaeon]|nr:V-type ATPase 116kDa subunit family protein [Nitrososphaerales archaeon]
MAIARLSSVVLLCPRSEAGLFLSRLCKTRSFHPSERSGLVQDTQLVILASRAHAAYSKAGELLRREGAFEPSTEVVTFTSTSMVELVAQLESRSSEIESWLQASGLAEEERRVFHLELLAIKEAALSAFSGISRIRVRPGPRRFLVMEGFVPTDRLDAFAQTLGGYLVSSGSLAKRQPGNPYIPSLLVNPRVVRLFEGITLSLGVPKYNEVDPTPVVAFVFPLFFGIMFSDVGRGLVLFLVGLLLRNNPKENYRYLGRLLLVLGTSAVFVGALRGLFFGLSLPYPAPLATPSFLTQGPSLQTIAFWLEASVVIGTLHLSTGYILAIVNHVLSKDYVMAFLSYTPTLALYAAVVPLIFALVATGLNWDAMLTSTDPLPFFSTLLGVEVPLTLVVLIALPVVVSAFAVLLFGRAILALYSSRRPNRAIRPLADGVAEVLIRPAELLIHTVSYIRLGILLVVGSVLGELLSGLFRLGPAGIILAVFGNLGVIGIEAFIVYIQDLRLNVYEWFSKFYSGTGKPFRPIELTGSHFAVR